MPGTEEVLLKCFFFFFSFLFFSFLFTPCGMRDLCSQLGIEQMPPALDH